MAEVPFKAAVYLPGSVLMGIVQELKAGVNWFVAQTLVNIVNRTQDSAASCGRREAAEHKPEFSSRNESGWKSEKMRIYIFGSLGHECICVCVPML